MSLNTAYCSGKEERPEIYSEDSMHSLIEINVWPFVICCVFFKMFENKRLNTCNPCDVMAYLNYMASR
jgi:hypothetical protein